MRATKGEHGTNHCVHCLTDTQLCVKEIRTTLETAMPETSERPYNARTLGSMAIRIVRWPFAFLRPRDDTQN